MNQIYYWDDFLTIKEFDILHPAMEANNWVFDGISLSYEHNERIFWRKLLTNNSKNLENVFKKKIQDVLNKTPHLSEDGFYANGQAHGQCGAIHKDVYTKEEGKEHYTLVYFYPQEWKAEYGGHLIFVDDKETTVTNSFFPKPNSAVMFSSYMNHCGLEPTTFCRGQRISIAFKFYVEV